MFHLAAEKVERRTLQVYILLQKKYIFYTIMILFFFSQQQNALGYNLSMQGIGTVAIDGPRFEEFFEVSQGGLARILLLGCTAGLMAHKAFGCLRLQRRRRWQGFL